MTDREKVIKAVEDAFDLVHSDYIGTDDFNETEWEQNKADAIALLKEQEAKHVNISQTHCGMTYGLCPQCEKRIDTLVNPNYCGFCGQELKWK